MNLPGPGTRNEIPTEAQGNPVYEQTRQDMPLWCCGHNCGRNSRVFCTVLVLIGIGCSLWACLSADYFSFVALRNDTFFDPAKAFPAPFEYATEADVGLFKYRIIDVFEYPWPPKRERALADRMLLDELRRMQEEGEITEDPTLDPTSTTPSMAPTGPTAEPSKAPVPPTEKPSASPTAEPTKRPTANPTINLDDCEGVDSLEPGPGSVACGVTRSPTGTPSVAPTITNPNDIIAEQVQLGVVLPYEKGIGQFDSTFSNAQRGAILGPVFALIGTIFSLIELCFCTYKCSWLPSAIFLYLAFMFQLFTLFLFLSEDWCKYDQECALGNAGYGSVIAVVCYMIAQNLMCCSPRPTPLFPLCKSKKSTPKRKKKTKRSVDEDENDGLTRDYDEPGHGQRDRFRDDDDDDDDENDRNYNDRNYDDDDDGDDYRGSYNNQDDDQNDLYSSGYDNDSYYTENDGTGDSYYTEDDQHNNSQRY